MIIFVFSMFYHIISCYYSYYSSIFRTFFFHIKFVRHVSRRCLDQTLSNLIGISYAMWSCHSKPKWSPYGAACLAPCKYSFPLKYFNFWIFNDFFNFYIGDHFENFKNKEHNSILQPFRFAMAAILNPFWRFNGCKSSLLSIIMQYWT
jgi:hypothetical protein